MSLSKNLENDDLANQISAIRETTKIILKNTKHGSNENLLRDLSKIDSISSRIYSTITGNPPIKKYKKILVPYDGSSFSKNALSEALEIAKAFGSKLYVLSVIEVASDVPPGVLSDVINKKLNKLKRAISLPKNSLISKIFIYADSYCTANHYLHEYDLLDEITINDITFDNVFLNLKL
jgi:hypothetical protein